MYKFRELRKIRGLKQREIAEKIDVSTQSYGYYENGINHPDPQTLIKLADFFGCSIDYLVGREDDFGNVTVQNVENAKLTKDEQTLLSCFNKLGIFEREAILIQIKALAGESKSVFDTEKR